MRHGGRRLKEQGAGWKRGKRERANCIYPLNWLFNGHAMADLIVKERGMDLC
jgi:hypothetical protein